MVVTEEEVRAAWKLYQTEYAQRRTAAYQTAARAVQQSAQATNRYVNGGLVLAAAQAAGRAALTVFDRKYPEVGSDQPNAARDMWQWWETWKGWDES